jgi:hypothetical protein
VTFTTQEAKERICKWRSKYEEDGDPNESYVEFNKDKKNHFTVLGHRLEYETAPEPSDVIWENLEITRTTQF